MNREGVNEGSNRGRRKVVTRREVALFALGLAPLAIEAISKRNFLLNLILGTESDDDSDVQKAIAEIKKSYGIEITVGEPSDRSTFAENPNTKELKEALLVLVEELFKYPPKYFDGDDKKVLRINIVKNLRIGTYSFYNTNSLSGQADSHRDIMLLDVENIENSRSLVRETIHHELFHLYDEGSASVERDKFWREVSSRGACSGYFDLSYSDYFSKVDKLSESPCFVSLYGQNSPAEERAVLAERIMIPNEHKAFLDRIRVLKNSEEAGDSEAAKILLMKLKLMKQYYYNWSDGKMDKKYWENMLSQADDDTDCKRGCGSGSSGR